VAALIVVTFHLSEPLGTGHLDILVNHGYLAVDFFFLLSGFVIGYAYDERWPTMRLGTFLKRRFERLQPMVVLGMTLGALGFYWTDSPLWPLIHTVPLWKLLLVMLIGYTILPVPLSLDIRGWQEMHPLNSVGWSLFFEYLANLLYALGLRKLSNAALSVLVVGAALALAHLAITSPAGDVSGGWTLNAEQVRIGLTRMLYPFFAGLLLCRVGKPTSSTPCSGAVCCWPCSCICPAWAAQTTCGLMGSTKQWSSSCCSPCWSIWGPVAGCPRRQKAGYANFSGIFLIRCTWCIIRWFISTLPGLAATKG
jgi:peptidoglycan/LPS O-acetylase OafA/YrhL